MPEGDEGAVERPAHHISRTFRMTEDTALRLAQAFVSYRGSHPEATWGDYFASIFGSGEGAPPVAQPARQEWPDRKAMTKVEQKKNELDTLLAHPEFMDSRWFKNAYIYGVKSRPCGPDRAWAFTRLVDRWPDDHPDSIGTKAVKKRDRAAAIFEKSERAKDRSLFTLSDKLTREEITESGNVDLLEAVAYPGSDLDHTAVSEGVHQVAASSDARALPPGTGNSRPEKDFRRWAKKTGYTGQFDWARADEAIRQYEEAFNSGRTKMEQDKWCIAHFGVAAGARPPPELPGPATPEDHRDASVPAPQLAAPPDSVGQTEAEADAEHERTVRANLDALAADEQRRASIEGRQCGFLGCSRTDLLPCVEPIDVAGQAPGEGCQLHYCGEHIQKHVHGEEPEAGDLWTPSSPIAHSPPSSPR